MSGELQVIFIYDTQRVKKEEDDPAEAILYFHPEEIPVNKRVAICGQLMGITQFLTHTFSQPRILTLENGKFALREFGKQYVLALGCSSVTPDWLLDKQANVLFDIIRFFHKDIGLILSEVGDKKILNSKLTLIMDHYIPISQHHGDLFALSFGILPILSLPKSANHIFLRAEVVLETCMLSHGVLGGVIMFQNKVVGCELSQNLAKMLSFIQPYQLPPADVVVPSFTLPPGVQLLKVFLNQSDLKEARGRGAEYRRLTKDKKSDMGGKDNEVLRGKTGAINDTYDQIYKSSDKGKPSKPSSETSSKREDQTDPQSSSAKKANSFIQSRRLFTSLGNLPTYESQEDEEHVDDFKPDLKQYSTSLADPYFPYLRPDGKNISKLCFDAYAYPNDDHSTTEEEEIDFGFESNNYASLALPSSMKSLTTDNALKPISNEGKLSNNRRPATTLDCDSLNEKENEQPKLTLGSQVQARPKDLALNLGLSKRKPRRRWSTFEDMMSPVIENPPADQTSPLERGVLGPSRQTKSASISITTDASDKMIKGLTGGSKSNDSDRSFKTTLFNSFRRISSPEDLSDSGRESSKSKRLPNQDNKPNHSWVASPDNPFKLWNPLVAKTGNDDPSYASDNCEDVVLFVYSLGGMRLVLLLEKTCTKDKDLIYTLRDYGCMSMADLEIALSNVEEQTMSMATGHHDRYCYLHYDPVWRSLVHGGRNHSMDFDVVQHMHQDFHIFPHINELIIRGDDHVVYGYQCVGQQTFYQQSAGPQPGLPIPSDLFGKIALKAKRRLERDHNILLL